MLTVRPSFAEFDRLIREYENVEGRVRAPQPDQFQQLVVAANGEFVGVDQVPLAGAGAVEAGLGALLAQREAHAAAEQAAPAALGQFPGHRVEVGPDLLAVAAEQPLPEVVQLSAAGGTGTIVSPAVHLPP